MSIKASCDSCGKTYSLNEKYAGKRLPCKECGEPFQVGPADDFEDFEDEFEPPPRRPRRSAAPPPRRAGPKRRSTPPAKRSRKKTKKKRRSSGPNGAVIGIGAGLGAAVIGLIVVLMLTAFRDSPESMMEDMLDAGEDLAEVMEGIEDESSAKAAIPKVRRIGERMVSILREVKEWEKTHDVTRAEEKALREQFKDRVRKLSERTAKERLRLRKIPGALAAIQEGMKEPTQEMMKLRFEAGKGGPNIGLPF